MSFSEDHDAYFDGDGQPLNFLWNAANRRHRNYDELIGMIRGIIADGQVVRAEADLLATWCIQYGADAPEWPVNAIVSRLRRIYDDSIVTPEELDDLKLLLDDIVGGPQLEVPTALPLTRPAPEVIFDRNCFVFTGSFAYGTRSICAKDTALRGGTIAERVNLSTDYLVIGSVGSRDWKHSAWGNKIERAIELQRSKPIAIISEQRWSSYLL